jgi:hypothetical protein
MDKNNEDAILRKDLITRHGVDRFQENNALVFMRLTSVLTGAKRLHSPSPHHA